nr:Peroxisomal membrane protein 4 [Polyrhizophydium stewartii]
MARSILTLTYQHSRNLAFFVTIYKTLLLVQRKIKGFEHNADSFIAGIIGGYIVFGKNTAVNNQIVLYLFSRISVGLAKLAVKRKIISKPQHSFPVFAALTWGIVMWLFRHDRDTLQPSLQSSMQYLYNDSDVFDSIGNWLLSNK